MEPAWAAGNRHPLQDKQAGPPTRRKPGYARWAADRSSLEGLDGVAAGVRVEHAPADELLSQVSGRFVVDDRERAQVLMPHRQHPAVVVAALRLDGGDVASQRADLLLRQLVHPLKVDHQLGRT